MLLQIPKLDNVSVFNILATLIVVCNYNFNLVAFGSVFVTILDVNQNLKSLI